MILARFDKANHQLAKKSVNLQTSIDDVLHRYRTAIAAKKIAVHVKAINQSTIISDPYYLDLIFDNLLSNAVKYAYSDGTINIVLSQENGQLHCQIKDTGIGIQAADMDNIFIPFFRSDALNHKEITGNGLGLSIVKKACDLMGIGIVVTSEVGEGSCFRLTFEDVSISFT